MVLKRPIGEFRLADVQLTGLADKHQCHSEGQQKWDQITVEFGFPTCPPNNPLAFDNTIQIVETGGLRITVWGNNRPEPDAHLDKMLANLDVFILPVDGTEHILTYREVNAIIARYHPKAVIPAHYLVKGAESVLSGLKSANEWVATPRDVRRIADGKLDLTPADLKAATGRCITSGMASSLNSGARQPVFNPGARSVSLRALGTSGSLIVAAGCELTGRDSADPRWREDMVRGPRGLNPQTFHKRRSREDFCRAR
jgi:hypothetical protein